MDMLNYLIGANLIHIDDDIIIVSKDGKEYHFDIKADGGDCRGYSDVETILYISEDEMQRKPIIKNADIDNDDSNGCEEVIKITLFGENKLLAEIIACAGSGSGECCGTYVSVCCRETKIKEHIVEF